MIPEFALRLICGLSTTWCLAPRREITSGYFRIQNLLCLGLGVLTTLTAGQSGIGTSSTILRIVGIIAAIAAFAGSVFWTLERRVGGTRLAGGLAILSTVAVASVAVSSAGAVNRPPALTIFDSLSSAWLIGSTTAAMLLGHWYLTATGMRLTPLIQYVRLAGLAIGMKGAVALAAALLPVTGSAAAPWTLLALRWAGIVGPLIMVGLTLTILKYRNTQSATGVLYAATILVFMGEMAAALLSERGAWGSAS